MTSSKHSPADRTPEASEQDQQLISRRQLIKAGWTLPLITAVTAPKDLFAAGSFTGPTPPPTPAPDRKVSGSGSGSTDDGDKNPGYYEESAGDSGSDGIGDDGGGTAPGGSPGSSSAGSSGSSGPLRPRLPYDPRNGSLNAQTSGSLTTSTGTDGGTGSPPTLGWRPDSTGNPGGDGSTS